MTEGELYKKLVKYRTIWQTRRQYQGLSCESFDKEVLDEAKKDFPVNTQVKSEKGYKEFMPTPFLYKKWFQKWFGSEQP